MKKDYRKDSIGGQPKKRSSKMTKGKKDFFDLGKTVAQVEAQKRQNEQMAQMTLAQTMQLQQSRMELMQILDEITRKQKQLDAQMTSNMMPPLPDIPVPLGMQPPEGMPPEMMGAGPGPQGAPPMPPEMMGAGPMPPMG